MKEELTWRFSEYLSIHVSQMQVVTILRARNKQEEPYLE